MDSLDDEEVVIDNEDHRDNEAGEGQKDDIGHVLHAINAVLKTAGYKKAFLCHPAPNAKCWWKIDENSVDPDE